MNAIVIIFACFFFIAYTIDCGTLSICFFRRRETMRQKNTEFNTSRGRKNILHKFTSALLNGNSHSFLSTSTCTFSHLRLLKISALRLLQSSVQRFRCFWVCVCVVSIYLLVFLLFFRFHSTFHSTDRAQYLFQWTKEEGTQQRFSFVVIWFFFCGSNKKQQQKQQRVRKKYANLWQQEYKLLFIMHKSRCCFVFIFTVSLLGVFVFA